MMVSSIPAIWQQSGKMAGKSQTNDDADSDAIGVCAISSIFVIRKCLPSIVCTAMILFINRIHQLLFSRIQHLRYVEIILVLMFGKNTE